MISLVKDIILQKPEYKDVVDLKQRGRDEDLKALVSLINWVKRKLNKDDISMAEIGCFFGESSNVFANNVKELYCVDSWDSSVLTSNFEIVNWSDKFSLIEKVFDEVVDQNKNIIKCKGKSLDIVNNFKDKQFDFIYIDANHAYESVKEDLIAWKSKTTRYIGGHDFYIPIFSGVVKAVEEVFGKVQIFFDDTSYICEVKDE